MGVMGAILARPTGHFGVRTSGTQVPQDIRSALGPLQQRERAITDAAS